MQHNELSESFTETLNYITGLCKKVSVHAYDGTTTPSESPSQFLIRHFRSGTPNMQEKGIALIPVIRAMKEFDFNSN